MGYVRRIGKWEVENSITDNKIYISDLDGKLLATFDKDKEQLDMIEWIQNNR